MHITNGCRTSGDGLAITNDLNPTVPKTVGDVLLEPAVIGVAVVVNSNTMRHLQCQSLKGGSQGNILIRADQETS